MDNQSLQKRIEELEKWKAEKEKQQIKFPLDVNSIIILNKYFMSLYATSTYIGGAGGNTFVNYIGKQDDRVFQVSKNTFIKYTVNITTNYLTIAGGERFDTNMQVYFSTSDTAPSPIDTTGVTDYFIINASSDGQTFQISTTMGGSAVDITNTGVGEQYIYFFQ
jgi:hypothetical protein